uniref:Uncharacterized protein n=1 Tax=Glossina austeni TaxID=7395 RepID=A0A1A9VY47_GLOAU
MEYLAVLPLVLWKEIKGSESTYNGGVEAAATLLGAGSALAGGSMKFAYNLTVIIGSLIMGSFLTISSIGGNVWFVYTIVLSSGSERVKLLTSISTSFSKSTSSLPPTSINSLEATSLRGNISRRSFHMFHPLYSVPVLNLKFKGKIFSMETTFSSDFDEVIADALVQLKTSQLKTRKNFKNKEEEQEIEIAIKCLKRRENNIYIYINKTAGVDIVILYVRQVLVCRAEGAPTATTTSRPLYKVNQCESHKLKIVTAADDNGKNGDEDEEKNVTLSLCSYNSAIPYKISTTFVVPVLTWFRRRPILDQANSLSINFTVKFGTGILFGKPVSV